MLDGHRNLRATGASEHGDSSSHTILASFATRACGTKLPSSNTGHPLCKSTWRKRTLTSPLRHCVYATDACVRRLEDNICTIDVYKISATFFSSTTFPLLVSKPRPKRTGDRYLSCRGRLDFKLTPSNNGSVAITVILVFVTFPRRPLIQALPSFAAIMSSMGLPLDVLPACQPLRGIVKRKESSVLIQRSGQAATRVERGE